MLASSELTKDLVFPSVTSLGIWGYNDLVTFLSPLEGELLNGRAVSVYEPQHMAPEFVRSRQAVNTCWVCERMEKSSVLERFPA